MNGYQVYLGFAQTDSVLETPQSAFEFIVLQDIDYDWENIVLLHWVPLLKSIVLQDVDEWIDTTI